MHHRDLSDRDYYHTEAGSGSSSMGIACVADNLNGYDHDHCASRSSKEHHGRKRHCSVPHQARRPYRNPPDHTPGSYIGNNSHHLELWDTAGGNAVANGGTNIRSASQIQRKKECTRIGGSPEANANDAELGKTTWDACKLG
ncbi:hypothetical protein A0H81_04676 [Grifola frondosa]|uniref:Uncharacterized protein n=1 Tax=Grifola frondosa TaxID=5627 RepID=A0A1C7MK88_GRIFR|nr:hypothetical protein A0H81_04676 [Grifola frondosa]